MTKSTFTRRNNDTAISETACAIVFCVFSFIYLFFYQDDLLTMEQHILSGGLTKYNATAGALIITVLLMLVQQGLDGATNKSIKVPALTYFPSAILLAILTDISPDVDNGYQFGKWAWLTPILTVLFCAIAYISAYTKESKEQQSEQSALQKLWINMIVIAAYLLFICTAANNNRAFHTRMEIENLVANGQYKNALKIRSINADNDSSTTMLKAYALAKEGMLGERLFEYKPYGGSAALLPNGKSVKFMIGNKKDIFRFIAEPSVQEMSPIKYMTWMKEHGYAKKPLRDYLLCAYLLDKRIDSFIEELSKEKDVNYSKLPKHYKEALILYNHIRSTPIIEYKDNVMDADYQDMIATARKCPDKTTANATTDKAYGNTYWYYYYFN